MDDNCRVKRLREIAQELEEMAEGYIEKAAQLQQEAARNRAAATLIAEGNTTVDVISRYVLESK